MAIESGWDPEQGVPLPCPPFEDPDPPAWVPLSEDELAWFDELDRALPVSDECPWDDEDPEPAREPGWAVPGVTSSEEAPEEGLSARSQAELAEAAEAVRALRLAGARLYRAVRAIRCGEVLAETGYQRLSRLLEDHLRLDAKTVTMLDRHATLLHETVTPTGATTPADLPATAVQVEDGVIDEHHVEVIAKTMDRLRTVPGLDEQTLGVAEEQLAGLAGTRSPRALASAAKVIADRLDPDGAAPVDDDPAGNELHFTKRRNGHLHAKIVLREPTAAALFDDAIRAATPKPASAVVADRETGLPPVSDDGRQVGIDPRVEARDSKPSRQAHGLLDLIAASHRVGLDHPDAEQHPDSPTASMPLPDLDDHGDTTACNDDLPSHGATGSDADETDNTGNEPSHGDADDDEGAAESVDETGDETAEHDDPADDDLAEDLTDDELDHGHNADAEDVDEVEVEVEDDEPRLFGAGPPDPETDSEPPPHTPWTPPDFDSMALPGRERVCLTVTVDYETLRQQLTDTSQALALLGDSTWIRPDTARRLACDADVIPIVLGSKGEVLDVGRKTRAIPTATGRAVTHRDRHCAFPGCRRKARTSEIHHIQHWADLGETEPDNLVCLCRYHHGLVHHSGWEVIMIEHMPWFRPPHWLDPTRTLRHNRPWQLAKL